MKFRRFPRELKWYDWRSRLCTCVERGSICKVTNAVDKFIVAVTSILFYFIEVPVIFLVYIMLFTGYSLWVCLKYVQWCLYLNSQEEEEKVQAYIKRKLGESHEIQKSSKG